MIAQLQRFYGGDPLRWLELPPEIVRNYAEQMGRIQSREALLQVGVGQIAEIGVKPAHARQQIERWQRMSRSGRRKPADLERLRAAGIAVEHRKADRKGGD